MGLCELKVLSVTVESSSPHAVTEEKLSSVRRTERALMFLRYSKQLISDQRHGEESRHQKAPTG